MVPVQVPAEAPAWLRDSVADITKVDLGCHFAAVLAALIRLEKAVGYEVGENKKLPGGKKLLRPQIISDWIKGGRGQKTKKAPVIGDVDLHVAEWDAWWDGIQPDWRARNTHGRWRADGTYEDNWDWGALDCSGVNGLLSAVAALYFWGVAVRMGPEEKKTRWEQSVLDVVWVLEGLERTHS
jgi:hypothetical protein